jgi:predicted Rossmann fold flavoprotein
MTKGEGFRVRYEGGELLARRVIVATGGRSLPKTGSDGGGYGLVKALGHTVTGTWPALVPLVLEERFFHAEVSGLAVEGELSVVAGGKRVDRRRGSLLFTHFGVSGPVVMDASRHYIAAADSGVATLLCNFFPGETADDVERRLIKLAESRNKATVGNALGALLPQRLAEAVVRFCGVAPATTMSQLPKVLRRQLAVAMTAMVLPVVRDRGWNYAEVTAGGVPMSEVDFRTMGSRKCPGLYLAGEIVDVDGRIGGFNFQWAWATGYLAGTAAGRSPREEV